MRIAYADPPYPGCAHLYPENTEVDSAALMRRCAEEFDGFVFHTHVPALAKLAPIVEEVGARVMAWVKPFAAFKRNVPVAYAWEPVIVKPCRKPVVSGRIVMRDWVSHGITLKKGLVGAKPPPVVRWAFEVVGAQPGDDLIDLFPGTGIVMATWEAWRFEVASSAPGGGK